MRTLTVCLVIVALVVYSAGASPCTDICGGQCALASQACDFTGTMGDLCGTLANVCAQTCAAACHCVDTCGEQCGGEYAACKGDDSGVLNVATCGLNLNVCGATCQSQCQFDSLSAIISGLTGAL
ncbi:hypothetical protein PoB_006466400 [Plakobranchus ocellatus]|uniref:Uncharacterized protein n=1 Tax=Plakobranchus ocellatus TaxID=259542 RepID=A0AAV4D1W6_9GAST|nr:hypothetical protein PoB_006466400 [Plakobranchus ocellatus]